MTINKEQPVSDAVSDAMIEAGFNAAGSRRYWLDEDSLSAIYLAMKAASHPLEQQQAVSGDERPVAQFFFEVGYAACFAEVMIRNGMRPPFELTDAHIEGAWPRSIEAHEDPAEMNRYLARAALAASGMGTWQPIETAPKDATRILIAMPRENGAVCEAWWATEYEGGPGYWSTPPSCTGRGYTILADYPTHWMPLPEPPRTALQEEGVERRD